MPDHIYEANYESLYSGKASNPVKQRKVSYFGHSLLPPDGIWCLSSNGPCTSSRSLIVFKPKTFWSNSQQLRFLKLFQYLPTFFLTNKACIFMNLVRFLCFLYTKATDSWHLPSRFYRDRRCSLPLPRSHRWGFVNCVFQLTTTILLVLLLSHA